MAFTLSACPLRSIAEPVSSSTSSTAERSQSPESVTEEVPPAAPNVKLAESNGRMCPSFTETAMMDMVDWSPARMQPP